MSHPEARDDTDPDPNAVPRPPRLDAPKIPEREPRDLVDRPVDDVEPDGYGFGV
jgi:hypothetical protein